MSIYVESWCNAEFDRAVKMAIEFLTSENWESLAAPLQDYIKSHDLDGDVEVYEGAYLQDGAGDVFEAAMYRVLEAEVGEDRIEQLIDKAKLLIEAYESFTSESGRHSRFCSNMTMGWRASYYIHQAQQDRAQQEGRENELAL